MEYSPNGKFLCIQGETDVVVLSALTGKKKFEVTAKQFCFAGQFDPERFTQADRPSKLDYSGYESQLEA